MPFGVGPAEAARFCAPTTNLLPSEREWSRIGLERGPSEAVPRELGAEISTWPPVDPTGQPVYPFPRGIDTGHAQILVLASGGEQSRAAAQRLRDPHWKVLHAHMNPADRLRSRETPQTKCRQQGTDVRVRPAPPPGAVQAGIVPSGFPGQSSRLYSSSLL